MIGQTNVQTGSASEKKEYDEWRKKYYEREKSTTSEQTSNTII